ncbi:MAG: DUF4058 family protein [Chloroflexota bacterium]
MPSPFPGMDPYLEQAGLWSQVHTELIVDIRRFLTPLLRPKYRVDMEQRNYLAVAPPDDPVGEPDVIISVDNAALARPQPQVAGLSVVEPLTGQLPVPEEVKERYLEIRTADTRDVVTVIEILSPTNERAGDGREKYEQKRQEILGSRTHLIEIDLLRAGRPMPMTVPEENHYRIVVSRARRRPSADFYLFSVRQPIPDIPVPLLQGDEEPAIKLNQILHELYDQSGYDMDIDYAQAPPPPTFAEENTQWVKEVAQRGLTPTHSNGANPL